MGGTATAWWGTGHLAGGRWRRVESGPLPARPWGPQHWGPRQGLIGIQLPRGWAFWIWNWVRPGHPEYLEVQEGKQIVWATLLSGQVLMSFSTLLPGLPSSPRNSQQGPTFWRISSTTSHYCSFSFRFSKGCISTLIREGEAKITNLWPFMYQVLGRCLCIFYIL